jgi:hypothetical protein
MRASILAGAAALLVACGGGPGGAGPTAPPAALELEVSLAGAPVAALAIEVTAPDLPARLVFNLALADGRASGSLDVPAGAARSFTARAFDRTGIETHRATATRSIVGGPNPPVVLELRPIRGVQPVEVSLGRTRIDIVPAAARLAPGDTLRLVGRLLDDRDRPVEGRTEWATLDPETARVDPFGLVTAAGAGEARIVAVHGGAGALLLIRVDSH